MNFNDSVSYERAHELLEYRDGALYWRESRGRVAKGSLAGYICKDGYRKLVLDRVDYYVHRIVWLLSYGSWPENEIDHKDQNKLNNQVDNLRVVTSKTNCENKTRYSNNSSGYTGVFWNLDANKWQAQFVSNKKKFHIGYFENKEDAHKAVTQARLEAGFHKNHGR